MADHGFGFKDPQSSTIEVTLDDILAAIESLGGSSTAMSDGRKSVAVTGTAIALGSAVSKVVFITAFVGNSGPVVIGGSTVVFTEATRTGKLLFPGDSMTVSIDNLSKLYVNGTSGDGVTFSYTT